MLGIVENLPGVSALVATGFLPNRCELDEAVCQFLWLAEAGSELVECGKVAGAAGSSP